jgi:predicted metal-dependent hydrolase
VKSSIRRTSAEKFRDPRPFAFECVDSRGMDDLSAEQRFEKCEKAIENLEQALQVPPALEVGGKSNQLAELLVLARKNEEAIAKLDNYVNAEVRGRLSRITQDLRALKPSY